MNQKYYSTSEIAEMLEVNRYTVSLWIDHGEMKAMVTPGGHKKVSRDEVARFIRARGGEVPAGLEASNGKKIFIIDDESDVAVFFSRCISLVYEGIKPETFNNPVHGLIEIGKAVPDMVILDIFMPDMDGINVCRMIRENKETENIKIIAASGKQDRNLINRVMEAGADDFFFKLSPIEDLIEKVSKHIGIAPNEEKLRKLTKKRVAQQ
jgi:excisionase family DNA binding protein